jgi:dTDP-4-dehydrorhamnose reductase
VAHLPLAWVTGAGGLIGNYLCTTATGFASKWRIAALTREKLDLTDFPAVRARFKRERPGLIIHCAALSRSPACQSDPALAKKLNVDVTAYLSELASRIPFIFLSSDLVFDGRTGNYDESATVGPLSVYAETKVAAERHVFMNPLHTVVRTSLNGGISPSGDRGFNEEMRLEWKRGKSLKLFTDEFRSPLPAAVTARALWELAALNQPGLYHLAGAERLSRWKIGQLIAARWPNLKPGIEARSRKEYQGPPRPQDVSLNSTKIQALLSFPLPGLTQWLSEHPDVEF